MDDIENIQKKEEEDTLRIFRSFAIYSRKMRKKRKKEDLVGGRTRVLSNTHALHQPFTVLLYDDIGNHNWFMWSLHARGQLRRYYLAMIVRVYA